jgi:hypothetical protein
MKKVILIALLLALPLVCFGQDAVTKATPKYEEQPLQLVIQSDNAEYAVGDEINISYTLKNIGSKSVGFYISDYRNLGVDVFDSRGNKYKHFTSATQFCAPSIYPDEYVVLNPNEQRNGSISFELKKGELKELDEEKSGPKTGGKAVYNTIHDGLYLKCTKGCPYLLENILLSGVSNKAIKVSFQYITDNPNPRNFNKQDCKDANIFIDSYLRDEEPNKIILGAKCEGGACPELDDPLMNIKPGTTKEEIEEILKSSSHDLMHEERIHELAIYCQQNKTLTKPAWIGTLTSNTITIEVVEKK